MSYYAVLFERRVMGFSFDEASAQRLVDVFGEGASFERIKGAYPSNEYEAALAFERSKERRGLRLVQSRTIEDACESEELTAPGSSGFFAAVHHA